MIIPFSKIANKEINFELVRNNDLVFSGILKRKDPFLVKCQGTIKGEIKYICDRCGDEFMLPIDQDVELNLSDGVYKDRENELSDTVEFFDGNIDLKEVFESELEAFKSDYFYCEKCKNFTRRVKWQYQSEE
ncbi:YceD family protein [Campylobacter concisus]